MDGNLAMANDIVYMSQKDFDELGDFVLSTMRSKIHQKINAKGNALVLYSSIYPWNLMKRKYRNIEMFSPTILIPRQFLECRH